MHSKTALTPIILLVFFLASCCQITRGPTQVVAISSEPRGANVMIDGKICGTTPGYFKLKRKNPHTIVLSKDGYELRKYHVKTQPDAKIGLNALFYVVGPTLGLTGGCAAAACGKSDMAPVVIALGIVAGIAVGTIATCTGVVTDISSGANSCLSPNQIHSILQPIAIPKIL